VSWPILLSEEEKGRVPLTSGIKHHILADVCNVGIPADGDGVPLRDANILAVV